MTASTRLVVVEFADPPRPCVSLSGRAIDMMSDARASLTRPDLEPIQSKEPKKGWWSPLRIGYPQERQLW